MDVRKQAQQAEQEEEEEEELEQKSRPPQRQEAREAEQQLKRRQRRAEHVDEKKRIADLAKELIPKWLETKKIEPVPVHLTEGKTI